MNKCVQSLLSLTTILIVGQAQALETWLGTKHIHSVTAEGTYYIMVNMMENQTGVVATENGRSTISYSVQDTDDIALEIKGSISYVSYPYKVNELACEADPVNCRPQQVKQVSQLQSLVLSGQANSVTVKENWRDCALFPTNGQPDFEVCESRVRDVNGQMLVQDEITAKPLEIRAGDKVVVSVPGNDAAYLQLNGDYSVTVLASEKHDYEDIYLSKNIKSWSMKGSSLVLINSDGGTLTYTKTQEYEGVSRVLASRIDGSIQEVFAGVLMVDQQINMSGVTKEQMAGHYKTVSVNTTTQASGLLGYSFDLDGFGGFEYHSPYQVDPLQNLWSWDLENGDLVTLQYRYKLDQAQPNWPIDTKEEIARCMESLEVDTAICAVRMRREHKILAQEGNRYTMLRTLKFYEPETQKLNMISLSVWVYYKK